MTSISIGLFLLRIQLTEKLIELSVYSRPFPGPLFHGCCHSVQYIGNDVVHRSYDSFCRRMKNVSKRVNLEQYEECSLFMVIYIHIIIKTNWRTSLNINLYMFYYSIQCYIRCTSNLLVMKYLISYGIIPDEEKCDNFSCFSVNWLINFLVIFSFSEESQKWKL